MYLFPELLPRAHSFIAVASADHVARGRAQGFAQACHGKAAPLRRAKPGDTVISYAPTHHFGQRDKLQAFVAFGTIQGEVYAEGSFHRRDVIWAQTRPAPIGPSCPGSPSPKGQTGVRPSAGASSKSSRPTGRSSPKPWVFCPCLFDPRHDLSPEWQASDVNS